MDFLDARGGSRRYADFDIFRQQQRRHSAAVTPGQGDYLHFAVVRRLDGSLTEDEFRPLRLMNGVYLQLHAYMLRVAIPYGTIRPMR